MTVTGGFVGVFTRDDPVRTLTPTVVLLHGEIHNAAALCAELGLPDATPLPQWLAEAWQRWGPSLLPRLDGALALALRHGRRLMLHRDASGLRNLYFHVDALGNVHFGSDLNQLVQAPGVPRRLSRPGLHEYLRFGDIAAPNCIYQGVVALQPGETVIVSEEGLQCVAPPAITATGTADERGLEEALEHLSALLEDSLQARLGVATCPAAFLSGGVDSSLLCALASRSRPDLAAVTVGFDGQAFDESPVAARVAGHLGLRHEVWRFAHADCLAAFDRMAAGADQPTADPSTAVTLLALQACRERFDAVIDGTGADEAMGNMPARYVRLAVGLASRLPPSARRGVTRALRALPPLARHAALTDFEHPADTMIRWHGFSRVEIEELCGEPVSFDNTQFYRTFGRFPRHAHFERFSALIDVMTCERLNQATLLGGMPVRYPFCEPATNRWIRGLPVDLRYRPGEPKHLLRALLARHVPQALWDGPKHGLDFPLHSFMASDGHAVVTRYLNPALWAGSGAVSPQAVQRWARRYLAGEPGLGFRIWRLVVLGAWLEAHGDIQ